MGMDVKVSMSMCVCVRVHCICSGYGCALGLVLQLYNTGWLAHHFVIAGLHTGYMHNAEKCIHLRVLFAHLLSLHVMGMVASTHSHICMHTLNANRVDVKLRGSTTLIFPKKLCVDESESERGKAQFCSFLSAFFLYSIFIYFSLLLFSLLSVCCCSSFHHLGETVKELPCFSFLFLAHGPPHHFHFTAVDRPKE